MPWILQQYEDGRGNRPVEKFLESLGEGDRGSVKAKLVYLQERGNQLREPISKSLGGGLFELRVKAYRLFFCFRPGNRILVLHGIIKKSRATPKRELDLARKRMKEV